MFNPYACVLALYNDRYYQMYTKWIPCFQVKHGLQKGSNDSGAMFWGDKTETGKTLTFNW